MPINTQVPDQQGFSLKKSYILNIQKTYKSIEILGTVLIKCYIIQFFKRTFRTAFQIITVLIASKKVILMINPLIKNAYKVLDGEELTRSEALELGKAIDGSDILDLVSLANKVRAKFSGAFIACSIINAKSGVCSQNCKFCAQSAHHNTEIEAYPLLEQEKVIEAAGAIAATDVAFFGYVTSGFGYLEVNDEFKKILATLDELHKRYPKLNLCVSLGILSRETAKMLAEHHVRRYNMNLQVAPHRYADLIATTHTIEDKIQTIKYLQEFGVEICCGGILGLGETMSDRIEMALTVRELKVHGTPLNVLVPIKGTPLESQEPITPAEVAKSFTMFRIINPANQIKFAAGRESVMKDFMGLLMLSGLDSMMTGGYLTIRGRSIDEDSKFIRELEDFS
jgi:biotin synthase